MAISNHQIITKSTDITTIDFQEGTVLLIDKPLDWTSFDVVNKLRAALRHGLNVKKIKVGHAGTLDPLATGLLLICTGKLTKEIDTLQAQHKVYSGSITLGATTPTYDSEALPDQLYLTDHITKDDIQQARHLFIGEIDQMPPIFSAIKVKGQKACDLARRGQDVALAPRKITIHSFDVIDENFPVLDISVLCSKGTYIRSLAHDFGKALQSGGYLSALRREAIGDYEVSDAFSIEEAVVCINQVCSSKV